MKLRRLLWTLGSLVIAATLPSQNATNSTAGNQIFPGAAFAVELLHGFAVSGIYSAPLPNYGLYAPDPWTEIAEAVKEDAKSATYRRGKKTRNYDVWPKATLDSRNRVIAPSFIFRFSLIDVSTDCSLRRVTAEVLESVAFLLWTMARAMEDPSPTPAGCAFSGTIYDINGPVFFIRLFDTGVKAARDEKTRDIDGEDIRALTFGREIILDQTSPDDLILFLGSSGSYFYYTLNLPNDRRASRRQAFLLPVSQAELWTAYYPLDQIRWRKEYFDFVHGQLIPIFQEAKKIRRVIFVDYTCSGTTLLGMQRMLLDNGIWLEGLYYINIESPEDPHGIRPVHTFRKLHPIAIESFSETSSLIHGNLGRIIPPYPWFFWDVPPNYVQYPGMDRAAALVGKIRDGVQKRSNSLNSTFTPGNSSMSTERPLSVQDSMSVSYSIPGNGTQAWTNVTVGISDDDCQTSSTSNSEDVPQPRQQGYECRSASFSGEAIANVTVDPGPMPILPRPQVSQVATS